MSAWLAQIAVSPRCTRIWSRGLLDAQSVHRDLMRLAEDNLGEQPRKTAGMLWRAEDSPHGLQLLVQMSTPPNLERLQPDLAITARQRDLTPLLNRLHTGMHVRFRISANATKRHGNSEPDKKGKLANLRGEAAEEWWFRRAEQSGLRCTTVHTTSLPDVCGTANAKRQHRAVRHAVTRFEGTGIVTEPELLHTAVREGIGRARTYGCGLLSLGPI